MSLFSFNQEELLSFFAVLVRFSVLISILPFVGDRFVPAPVKILLAIAISIALFPMLISTGQVRPGDSIVWGATVSGIVGTIGMEVIFALILGFVARMTFESINFGANLVGSFMGFASASTFDPHQESQTQVMAEIQMAMAMLIFLAIDGHHLMLRASVDSFRIVGVGKMGGFHNAGFNASFSQKLIELSGHVVRYGVQLAAPIAVSLFAVNVIFGIMSKAMPQLNVLVLSFSVSAVVGLIVMFLSIPEFQGASSNILGEMGNWMESIMLAMSK